MEEQAVCRICNHKADKSLQAHINNKHGLKNGAYHALYPSAKIYTVAYMKEHHIKVMNRDPSYKKKLSENTKRLYRDKDWVSRHNKALKEAQNTPKAKKNHSIAAIKYFSNRTDKQILQQKECSRQTWKNPEIRKNRVAGLKQINSLLHTKRNHSEATKRYYQELNPEQRQHIRDNLKEIWAKPHLRKKILELSKMGLEKAMSPEGIKNRNLANLSPIVKEKRRRASIKRLLKQPKKSLLNFKFEKALNAVGLFPESEHPVYPYVVDFCFPEQKLIVEVDGDYWHGNPSLYSEFDKIQTKTVNKDKRELTFCKNQNWTLLRFWETDINKNINACIKKVQETLNE